MVNHLVNHLVKCVQPALSAEIFLHEIDVKGQHIEHTDGQMHLQMHGRPMDKPESQASHCLLLANS